MNSFADVRGKLYSSILNIRLRKTKQMLRPHTPTGPSAKVNLCTTVYSKHPFMPRTPNASANVNKNEEKNFNGKMQNRC